MQTENEVLFGVRLGRTGGRVQPALARQILLAGAAAAALLFLLSFNLTAYPATWFDEGSHLHVPKTLVEHGVYADISSEGYRYYGPTIGVGPTVMLPIAAAFRLFGIGLLQARLVMVIYSLAAVGVLWALARRFGDRRFALLAIGLVLTSQGVGLLTYGRQVLGEVPGLFFLVAGFVLWFARWEAASWRRLAAVGLLFGLAAVTKHQYLLLLVPTLGIGWFANLVYYRLAPQRVFYIPALVAGCCFGLWQIYLVLYLGPATATENLILLREATAGAALVFSPQLMKQSLLNLLGLSVYLGWLAPSLLYALFLALPRRRSSQQWSMLVVLVGVNFVWYVAASIGWLRYAFPGLAIAGLFVARFFTDMVMALRVEGLTPSAVDKRSAAWSRTALRAALLLILAAMIALPLGQSIRQIAFPGVNEPMLMADYLAAHVPTDALIETWEPEMGFLTGHRYHFPPAALLNDAVGYIWLGGSPPADSYDFVQTQHPDYVLLGAFSRWVDLYAGDVLAQDYQSVHRVGAYELFARSQ